MGKDDVNTKKDNATKKKTPFQLQSLEEFYAADKYPKQEKMEDYARSLGLMYNQVRLWFVERRRKEKRVNETLDSSNKSFRHGGKAQASKFNTVEPESDWSGESAVFSVDGHVGQKFKLSDPGNHKNTVSDRGTVTTGVSSRCGFKGMEHLDRLYGQENILKQLAKNCYVRRMNWAEKDLLPLQVLLSKEYILTKVFRKDGPVLGVDFDPLHRNAFDYCTELRDLQSCRDNQRITKRRKVLDSSALEPVTLRERNPPTDKYGMGKGLMTVWRATHSKHQKFPTGINFLDKNSASMPLCTNTSPKVRSCQVLKGQQQKKLETKESASREKLHEKGKPPVMKRKVPSGKDLNLEKHQLPECKLSVNESLEQSRELTTLIDDEELELKELQAGPDPLKCSAHLISDGRHGYSCPLCKDLLARFPPQSVKMKKLFGTRPWDSSNELVKKLFKVLQFLHSHSVIIEVCAFTVDDFAQAFHDKDSWLLGKIQVALLNQLLLDVEREITTGFVSRASKDCRFKGLLNFVREQELDVNFLRRSLNPLTWTEILRQILVAAGFGSKHNTIQKGDHNKERNQMAKYGLRPRTLKGELFSMLSKEGSSGLKVSEMARACQIVELDVPNTVAELDELICSTLSSDITLFEKIAPSAYRLRIDPQIKGKLDSQSDTDDSGSVDNDSENGSMSCNSDDSDDSDEMDSAVNARNRIVKYKNWCKKTGQGLTEYTEIDESYSVNAWVLGLMEGEYSNLSIEEKLDILVALVDLVGAGSSLRVEEPLRSIPVTPNTRYPGSGAKIKKSLMNHLPLPEASQKVHQEAGHISHDTSPADYANATSSIIECCSGASRAKNLNPGGKTGRNAHPLQSIYLGSDRRYNRYWIFLGPCTVDDPGHKRVYFESSDDGHWEVIDTAQALRALLSILDCRGTREAHLFASLEKREPFLCQLMDDYVAAVVEGRSTKRFDMSVEEASSGDGSSPISDVDNVPADTSGTELPASGSIVLELGRNNEEKCQKWCRLQEFDKWIWNSFYSTLNAVKYSKKSYMESLARCQNCHDLYWIDEKHCKICHTTFEIDFDLEERYAIHVATCREIEDSNEVPKHKVFPSQLQALKAAIHAIEASMPEAALAGTWTSSTHKLWVKRLRRTSSLPELLQVLADFVGAINEDWPCECPALGSNVALDEIGIYFQTMPQTSSAIALWMVNLDTVIAPYLDKALSGKAPTICVPDLKRKRTCTLVRNQ